MGLLKSIFGGGTSGITSQQREMLSEAKLQSEEDKEKFEALKRKQEEERLGLKQRGLAQQGGGRQGLMFGRSQVGVA